MTLIQKFNDLNNRDSTRNELENLIVDARENNNIEIVFRLSKALNRYPEKETFKLIIRKFEESGLTGAKHLGSFKEALDDCGRLRKGFKFSNGQIIKVEAKKRREVVKTITPVTPDASIKKKKVTVKKLTTRSKVAKRILSETQKKTSQKVKAVANKMVKKQIAIKIKKPDEVKLKPKTVSIQTNLFDGLNKPAKDLPIQNKSINRNSLAYKMANKPAKSDNFIISDKEISDFLGNIERKLKESVFISLTGGQGSMKTRMAFQFMNALAQNYKVGHASIEEHPESVLYFDKAKQYLNEKALNNIEAPEIKNLQELHKLVENNDVIVIDSFTKMQEIQKGFEVDKDLRKKYNGKLFIVIFQQTTDGKMRGGSKSQFDADIVLFTKKESDYRNNYVFTDKNRYQSKPLDGLHFNIFKGKLVNENSNENQSSNEDKTMTEIKRILSFNVN